MLKVPDVGEIRLLNTLATAWGNTLKCRLYTGLKVPADGDVLADYTAIEADFSGYAQADMNNPVVAGAVDGNGRANMEWDEVSFTHNGGPTNNTVTGYFVVDAGGNLLWAERFTQEVQQDANGKQVRFVPAFDLNSRT